MLLDVHLETAAVIASPDTKLSREITEFIRDTETPLLFNHSSRVYCFGALTGKRQGLVFDPELLYAGAMFHDLGLLSNFSSKTERFEVDGANAAREFLKARGLPTESLEKVWLSIALHTTPGIPQHLAPEVALVTAGVEMDVLGLAYNQFTDVERQAVIERYPRSANFKEDIINAFYEGIKGKPDTTFGNVKADVLTDKDKTFKARTFCEVIRDSSWSS